MSKNTGAMALWQMGNGRAEIRAAKLGDGILVKTLFSGISRGTEALVFGGKVPSSLHQSMRCNAQEGEFSFPLKYGYCAVGEVLEGEQVGKLVFALHPHQDLFRLPSEQLHVLPHELSAERAVLAANMETALNIVWDSKASLGDRVLVIGAGVVGLLVSYLVSRIPGVQAFVTDINPDRAITANGLGVEFVPSDSPLSGFDVVINTSASEAGLNLAIAAAGDHARVIEASWYGSDSVAVNLGGHFHQRRLKLVSSQVGSIPEERLRRWSFSRRLQKAFELLIDPALDQLITGESPFENLPGEYPAILNSPNTLCHLVRYEKSGA